MKKEKGMNRKMNLMPALLRAFAGMVMLAACGATGARSLAGKWKNVEYDDITWSFTGNEFTQEWGGSEGEKYTVPYKVKGNSIFTKSEMEFEIDGDTLTVVREIGGSGGYTREFERRAGASGASGAAGARALIGTWEGDYGITWSFTRNKFTQEMMGVKQTVPYKVKGNAISTEYQGAEVEIEFEIDGDTLTVDIMGITSLEFERVDE
jgi:hypothetical protein